MSQLPAAEWVDIAALRAWDKNPRKNADAIGRVADSIRKWGFASPIVARRADSRIIAGHTRWEAAKSIGCTQVPVRFMDLDENQANALAIQDNKLGEIADWDTEKLNQVLAELQSVDIVLDGFDVVSVEDVVPIPMQESESVEDSEQASKCPVCGK